MEAARLSAPSLSPAAPMPHSVEAEQCVLGAMLLDRDAIAIAAETLQAEDFYYSPHRSIYEAILTLFNRGDPVDLVTVAEELKRRGKLDDCGGQPYLMKLMEMPPSIANIADYCRIVEEKAILRQLIQVAHQIVHWASHHDGSLEDLIDRAEAALFRVGQRRVGAHFQPLTELLRQTYDFLDQRMRHPGTLMGIPTGFYELDDVLGGLHPSDLIIVAGRPSMGKTSFALSIAMHIATQEKLPVAIFSLEMSKQQLVQRLLCARARVNLHHLRTGSLREQHFIRLGQASHELYNAPLFIDDTPDLSPFEIRAKARRLKASEGLGCIVIDYLQLIRPPRRMENRVQEVTEVVRSLKSLARELNVPVVVLSQLSRSVEHRENKRPVLADLRDSGAIEAEADVVCFLYREDYYERGRRKPAETPSERLAEDESRPEFFVTEVIIAKNRNGPVTTVEVAFVPRYAMFENLSSIQPDVL
ncbi:Replicative DNA helicase [bacterium HR17]|uniref:Replicative DNA helicase n=1 Tax=Candidatus Fervidibacter japonicus TaxID=2035412 RepID=A0A2H5XB96_9BACT|nr:Replicative DNA helicase [bacterium HR17]